MSRTLIITEKPSVARDIAKVLKVNNKGDGYFSNETTIVSWAIGHLVTLADPEEYDEKLKKWAVNTLPIIPDSMNLKPVDKTKAQLNILKKLMSNKEVTSLICATDSGREGELIFRYIYEICKCKKPFKRLWISSMTESAIKEGFDNLKDGSEYDNLYYSAKCRSEADWLVGMNATRAYTIRYNVLLSIGRVQTPTLGLIVDKQKEIEAFKIEEFFEVQGMFEKFTSMRIEVKTKEELAELEEQEVKEDSNTKGNKPKKEETKIKDRKIADEIAEKISNKIATVTKVEKEEKKIIPHLLYDLTELQREANKKFGYSAKNTLDIAQSLYEKQKLITYPRTDSRYLSDDMKPKVIGTLKRLKGVEEFQEYIEFLEDNDKIKFSKRIIDNSKVSDHHAIIPTEKTPNFNSISSEEMNIYMLIASRFISVFHLNYTYEVTKVYFECEEEILLSKGTVIIEEGWQGVEKNLIAIASPSIGKKAKAKKPEEQELPILNEGEEHLVILGKVLEKKTKPPAPYNESTLLSAMENAGRFVEDESIKESMKDGGLGTPATRASIIERLLQVGYIERKGKSLIPTLKGMSLIAVVPDEIRSPETTGKWEKGLTLIAKGEMTDERFMGSIKRYVNFLVNDSVKRKVDITFPDENKGGNKSGKGGNNGIKKDAVILGDCPLCGNGKILENTKAFYCSQWQNDCKLTFWKNALNHYGVELTSDMIKELLSKKRLDNIEMVMNRSEDSGNGSIIISLDKRERLEVVDFNKYKK